MITRNNTKIVYEAVSDELMMSFGLFKTNDLDLAKRALSDKISPPSDLRLIERKTVKAKDWKLSEPVTVSGRYQAYSPSLDVEASVMVHVASGLARIDKSAPALVL